MPPHSATWNNKEEIIQRLNKSSKHFKHLKDEFKDDKDIAILAVKKDAYNMEFVSNRLCDDMDIILEGCKKNIVTTIRHSSDNIKNNYDLMVLLSSKNHRVFTLISDRLKNDMTFVKKIIITRKGCECLWKTNNKYSNDKEIAKLTLAKNETLLDYFSDEIKDDEEIVSIACNKNIESFQYVSDRLKDDKIFVCKFTKKYKSNPEILKDMGHDLKNDKELALYFIKNNIDVYLEFNRDIYSDYNVNLAHSLKFKDMNRLSCEGLLNDREFMFELLLNNKTKNVYDAFIGLPQYILNDGEIMLSFLETHTDYNNYVSFIGDELKNDVEFIRKAMKINPIIYRNASSNVKNIEEVAIEAININVGCIAYVSDELQDNKYFILKILDKLPKNALYYISRRLLNDDDFIYKAFEKNVNIFYKISENLYNNELLMRDLYQMNKQFFNTLPRNHFVIDKYSFLQNKLLKKF
jgi:hypothetical protein